MKRRLQPKGILLGLLLFFMAIASTALVYSVKAKQNQTTEERSQP